MKSMGSFIHSMFQLLFMVWILALPFIVFENIYEGAKIFVFWIGLIPLTLYWLIFKREILLNLLNKWDVWYWVWIVALTISSFTGLDIEKSIIGGGYRHQGVIFFIGLWVVGKSFLLLSYKFKKLFSKYFVIVVMAQCVLVIIQKSFNFDLTNGRAMGTFGEANAVSGFVNLGLFFSQNIYFAILIFITNLILESRTGILMFLVLIAPFIFKRKAILILIALLSFLFIFYISILRSDNTLFKFESRGLFNKIAISAISKSPIIGYGLESGDVVFEKEFGYLDINLEDLMIDRSHNFVLDILIWSGFLGLIPFCIWLFGNLGDIKKAGDYKKLISIIAFLIFGCLQPIWLVHWIILFLMINW